MTNVVAPRTRILTGPGVLYRSVAGTLFPGQVSRTVSNKAITAGVATITTSASHVFLTGDKVIVNIGDPAFDGLQTIASAPTGTTFTYAVTSGNVTSAVATGTAVSYRAAVGASGVGGVVAGSKFTDSWPAGWTPWGVTREGHEFKWTPSTGNIEVAESLLPLAIVTTGVEGSVSFEVVEFTAYNFAASLNGGIVTNVSGSGATQLSELEPPDLGAESRIQIGWEADNGSERALFVQCFQKGDVGVAHKKGTDNAGLSVEFGLEQPAYGKPFRRFYAGSVPVGTA